MADPIDPARVGIQLDRAEECGAIETDVAEWLRGLVRAEVQYRARLAELERDGATAYPARNAIISFRPR